MRRVIPFLAAIGLSACAAPQQAPQPLALEPVSVCFTPAERCAWRIVAAIDGAQAEIRIQAYELTAPAIVNALERAARRGVDVQAILDRSQTPAADDDDIVAMLYGDPGHARPHFRSATRLARAGIPVWIDTVPGIAHNKAIIIDRRLVIGGSYNFTRSAESRNAENVTFIRSADLAGRFLANWQARRAASELYGGGGDEVRP
jgi:phosphatidylserine/phosphatidylglycerophosphate/cardiolipin synthase-like enzyme